MPLCLLPSRLAGKRFFIDSKKFKKIEIFSWNYWHLMAFLKSIFGLFVLEKLAIRGCCTRIERYSSAILLITHLFCVYLKFLALTFVNLSKV